MRMKHFVFAVLISLAGTAFGQQNPPWSENPPIAQTGLPRGGAPQAGIPQGEPVDEAGPGVARLSFMGGEVSVKRGDSGDAVAGVLNAPLLAGDELATGPSARAEVQFDAASRVRLGSEVEARVAELQSGKFRMEVAHGTVSLSVVRDTRAQTEISAPNVSMRPLQRGLYRMTVGDDGVTSITVRYGQAEVFTQRGTEKVNQGQTMMVRGSADDPEFQIVQAIAKDDWDTWNEQRDQQLNHVKSYKYMNQDIEGGEELDAAGTWVNDPAYGEVWAPQVDPGWAPYREGRWVWEDYYGWTWVSSDPFGWAPYHYGNWYYGSVGWCWYPGAIYRPVFWRPALVAFFGFGGFGVGFGFGGWGHVGWLPLAPFEPFHPWYGRGFVGGFNGGFVANYHLANVNVTNIYRNARVNGAISGVASNSFSSGRFGSIARVTPDQVRTAGLVRGALPIAPSANNLRFNDRTPTVAARGFGNTRFVSQSPATTTAGANRIPFNQQRQAIQQSTQRYSQSVAGTGRPVQLAQRSGSGTAPSWDRFGSPTRTGTTSTPTANQFRQGGSTPQTGPGWSRFGSPGQSNRQGTASSATAGYPHFGAAGEPARSAGYGSGYSQNYGQGSAQSLRLSPSMVHNRAYDAPASNGAAYRQPAYSAPRSYSGPSYSAPRSYSAPAYSAPRSSAPAPTSHSSGGASHAAPASSGGHSGGGSKSSGGGGGHSR